MDRTPSPSADAPPSGAMVHPGAGRRARTGRGRRRSSGLAPVLVALAVSGCGSDGGTGGAGGAGGTTASATGGGAVGSTTATTATTTTTGSAGAGTTASSGGAGGAGGSGAGDVGGTGGTGGDPGTGGTGGTGGGGGAGGETATACPPYQALCNGVCIPIVDDPNNCGGCGVTCGAGQVCSAGGCADDCLGNLFECGGKCVDLKTDNENCNSCGFACGAGMGCVDGTCHPLVTVGNPPAACEDGGPPIVIEGVDKGDAQCAGDLAQTTFLWALCSCKDVELHNPLLTDAYDSTEGPYEPGQLGGGVGLNGDFLSTSPMDVWGALWASSTTAGLTTSNEVDVKLDLHVGGQFVSNNPFDIGLDAFVTGDVYTSSTLKIAGALHQTPGETVTGNVTYSTLIPEPVFVPPPCGKCEANEVLPIAEIVTAHQADNDNALIGLDPNALIDPGGPRRLDLPCGEYYLNGISTNAPLVVHAKGRVVLYVDGDVVTSSPIAFTVDPKGEFDILIEGALVSSAKMTIGSPNHPALTRLYLGGVGTTLSVTNDTDIGGFVYAARGKILSTNPLEVFGGIVAGDFRNDGSTAIHYDKQVLEAGLACPDPDSGGSGGSGGGAPACESCSDCGNQACIDGVCGSCKTNADCCAPLYCANGTCAPVPK